MARNPVIYLRHVIVGHEYLDGIEGLEVREPSEFDETAWAIDVEVLKRLEYAKAALRAAEEDVLAAWRVARVVKNPKYVPEESGAENG